VADDAVSTFSIDVDTGAYSLLRRRLVEQGSLPVPAAVRIEEMINYFDYDYPEPTGDAPVSITTEVGPCPWDDAHRLVRVGLQGKHVAPAAVPPRNLVFLVDVSGSMRRDLPLVVSSLTALTEQLGERDRIAIVVYAGAAGTVLPPTRGSDKTTIRTALARLKAGGSTNGGQGIEHAYALARKHFVKGGINRVVLATDGDFNVGLTSHEALVRLIEAKRRSGVFLSVLGFGGANYQDQAMEQLADKGNGNYAFIDSEAEAHKVLVEQVGGTLVTVAKDVKLQVTFDPNVVKRYRLVGYDNRVLADRDFADDTKDAGEIGSGHTVTALYEYEPAAAAGGDVMQLHLRYKEPDGAHSRLLEVAVPNAPSAMLGQASHDFRFAAAVAGFGQALRGVPSKAEPGSLLAVRDLAAGALGEDPQCRRAELVRLVERASALRGFALPPVESACFPVEPPPAVDLLAVPEEPARAQAPAPAAPQPFDWARFVLEVLYLLPPLLALPLFVMALRRPRRWEP
jgi:secreted protein with Ig-like and vWFA domain